MVIADVAFACFHGLLSLGRARDTRSLPMEALEALEARAAGAQRLLAPSRLLRLSRGRAV